MILLKLLAMNRLIKILLLVALIAPAQLFAQEICDNGIDDDNNGLIDLNDSTACTCNGATTTSVPSLIPNPSFENNSCCPNSVSDLHCADLWQQASAATSDYFNLCGYTYIPYNGFQPPPPPNNGGSGYVGFYNGSSSNTQYKEYVGACLLSPMLTGTSYTIDFDASMAGGATTFELVIYGAASCASLPFNGNPYGCPLNDPSGNWVVLGSQTLTLNNGTWTTGSITFVPTFDINAVVLGGNCSNAPSGANYYYLDGLFLNQTQPVGMNIVETGNWCANDIVLTATPDTLGGTWQWYLDGVALVGETNDAVNVGANNYGPGLYTAHYFFNSDCFFGNYTLTNNISVNPGFDVNWTCRDSVDFQSTSTSVDPITGYLWDFGDGNTSTLQDPVHAYTNPGPYTVTLTITTSTGCTVSHDSIVVAADLADIDFTFVDACLNTSSQFTGSDASTATIQSWTWDFGDGNTGTGMTANHTYTASGSYNVELIATTNESCDDTISYTVNVFPNPTADFTFNDDCENALINFVDNSNANGATIATYDYDFGDGSPNSALQSPGHTYVGSGTFAVTLNLTTSDNCSASVTHNVTIYPDPVADFTFTTVCENAGATQFTNTSSVSGGTIITNSWDFGNGNTSNALNPSHAYGVFGIENCTLVVTSDQGCMDTTVIPVEVLEAPVADFIADVTEGCVPLCVNFTDLSTSGSPVNNWVWNTDGLEYNTQNPQHCYGSEGIFDVSLTVTNAAGCSDSQSFANYITVHPAPTASFFYNPEEPDQFNEIVTFTNTSQGADSWLWDFDNGLTDAVNFHTQSTFVESGWYDVQLTVYSVWGCEHDTIIPMYVKPVDAFYAPNSFTPDGDGINDYFHIEGYNFEQTELMIFDRWGELLFKGDGPSAKWDGRANGFDAKTDVYVWKAKVEFATGIKKEYIGHVTLLK